MESGRHGPKSFMHRPAVRIAAVVLVVHAVCWIGWSAINPSANNNSQVAKANDPYERIRAAVESKD
ncbi:uncharacterized protein LOC111595554 [Drosophila hydei]|uniref:Uncharacterized protein LOC111595554 n=1 Tax=Drosophila hydei TaxID=7224 RepID=A0A6J1LDS2_DROHY|nr:uncharacterized protein LOC111595554 [Drosophila hydei]